MPDIDERPLPPAALWLIAIATGLVRLFVVLFLIGSAVSGYPLADSLLEIVRFSDLPGLRRAMIAQGLNTVINVAAILGLGTAVLIAAVSRNAPLATRLARHLVRVQIVLGTTGFLIGAALPYAIGGGIIAVLTPLVSGLPVFLVQLAFLICADVALRPRPGSVF